MLATELHQQNIPQLLDQFRALVGDQAWLEPTARVADDAKTWPYLRDYLAEQFRVALHLRNCSIAADANGGRLPWALTAGALSMETFIFASQVIDLARAARAVSSRRASILISRVREALRVPRMLQAMQLETRIATHFLIRGRRILFPELGNSAETFDLLVEDLGPSGLEFEAKVITRDKGRKIHHVESLHVLGPLVSSPLVLECAQRLKRGLSVRVTVPSRLPKDVGPLREQIVRQILAGNSESLSDGTKIRLSDFDVSDLGALTNPPSQQMLDFIEGLTGSRNSHRAILRPAGALGVLILTLDSEQPDSMLHETFVTFAESAARQLTGRRPGAFIATFEGICSDAILELARSEGIGGDYSALAWCASEFLERPDFPHIVGVGFLSEPDYRSADAAAGGIANWIPKKTSPLWDSAFSGFFTPLPGPSSRVAL